MTYRRRKQQMTWVYVQLEVQSISTAETSGDMALASHMEVVKDCFIATWPHHSSRVNTRYQKDCSCRTHGWKVMRDGLIRVEGRERGCREWINREAGKETDERGPDKAESLVGEAVDFLFIHLNSRNHVSTDPGKKGACQFEAQPRQSDVESWTRPCGAPRPGQHGRLE